MIAGARRYSTLPAAMIALGGCLSPGLAAADCTPQWQQRVAYSVPMEGRLRSLLAARDPEFCTLLKTFSTRRRADLKWYKSLPLSCFSNNIYPTATINYMETGIEAGISSFEQSGASICNGGAASDGAAAGGRRSKERGILYEDPKRCVTSKKIDKKPFNSYKIRVRNVCTKGIEAYFEVYDKDAPCVRQKQIIPGEGEPFGAVSADLQYPILLDASYLPAR